MGDADAFLKELDAVLPPQTKDTEISNQVETDDILVQLQETANSFKTLNNLVTDYTEEKKQIDNLKENIKETQFNHLNKKIQRLDRKNKRIVSKLKDLEKPVQQQPEEKKIITHERRQIQKPGINNVTMVEILENGTRKEIVYPKPPPPEKVKPQIRLATRLKKLIKPLKYTPPPVKANVPIETVFKGRTFKRGSIRLG